MELDAMAPPHINVIDMYHGNKVALADFALLKGAGLMGVIHKASQGLRYVDPKYQDRRKAATAAGLLWGAYHFMDASDAEGQAEVFLKACGITDANSDPFLLALDFEKSDHTPALHQATTFMAAIDRAIPGVSCVVYSGDLIRECLKPSIGGHQSSEMFGVSYFFAQHRLWLAEYGPHESIPYPWNAPIAKPSMEATPLPAPGVFLWQFTEKGRMAPLAGVTDGNFFDGSFEQLQARWLA
jgi:lysozyme